MSVPATWESAAERNREWKRLDAEGQAAEAELSPDSELLREAEIFSRFIRTKCPSIATSTSYQRFASAIRQAGGTP